jgi:ABC-type transport system substrate-binding protein
MNYLVSNLIIFLGVFISCAFFSTTEANNIDKGVVYCTDATIISTNPQRYSISSIASTISHAIYDRPLKVTTKTRTIKSNILSLSNVSDNKTRYTYNVRKGIKFHSNNIFTPTRELNAHDIKFSFDRLFNPDNPFYRNRIDFPFLSSSEISSLIHKINVISNYKIEFVLKQPTNLLNTFLSMDNAVILSKEYADTILSKGLAIDTLDFKAIGTGPYQQQNFITEKYLKLTPFQDYHDVLPDISPLVVTTSSNTHKRIAQLFTDECQIVNTKTNNYLSFIQQHANKFNITERNSIIGTFIVYNTKNNKFSDKNLRKAITHILNIDNLNKSIFFNKADNITYKQKSVLDQKKENFQSIPNFNLSNNDSEEMTSLNLYENFLFLDQFINKNVTDNENEFLSNQILGTAKDLNDYYKSNLDNFTFVHKEKYTPFTTSDFKQSLRNLSKQTINISIYDNTNIGRNEHNRIASYIKATLSKYGIQSKIQKHPSRFKNKLRKGYFDIAIIDVYSNKNNILEQMVRCPTPQKEQIKTKNNLIQDENYSAWCNEDLDYLYDHLLYENDPYKKNIIKKHINNILNNELPIVPLYASLNKFISVNRLKNFDITPYGGVNFKSAYIKLESKTTDNNKKIQEASSINSNNKEDASSNFTPSQQPPNNDKESK